MAVQSSLQIFVVVALNLPILGLTQSWAGRGLCGIATNMLDYNDVAMTTFCKSNLDFWWNWAHAPTNIFSASCAAEKYVPMVWGYSDSNVRIAKSGAAYLMGYNEPDLWGPPPGGWPGDYLASGSFPETFQCGKPKLAENWRQLVMSYLATNPDGVVISPSMADAEEGAASASSFSKCNDSPQTDANHMPWCPGWLKCFKESVIQLECGATNCWDVIGVIQFHSYVYTAPELIKKVQAWENVWAEDLQGTNGRSKKSLWLTEFSRAGTTNPSDLDGKARAFMEESIAYLKASEYVSGWSWFSQDSSSFHSFPIGDRMPDSDFWASDLIDASGALTVIGEKYVSLCAQRLI